MNSKMRVFIGLALLSVAFATPIQPVTLPKAPEPAFEAGIELAKPEMPTFEIPDMRPLIIPREVMEALMAEAPVDSDSLVSAVIFVDHAEDIAAVAEDIIDPVKIVEVAENNADVPLELAPVEESAVKGDAVIVVDSFDFRPEDLLRDAADYAVRFVDVAENIEAVPAALDEESPVEMNDIPAEPVRFVDSPIAESDIVADKVKVVEAPLDYPGQLYDKSFLRSL